MVKKIGTQSQDSHERAAAGAERKLARIPRERSASVIVPCFQAAATIDGALAALCAQTGIEDYEVIVVDNGSTDATAAKLSAWAQRFPDRVRVADEPNPGSYNARNCGARSAVGKILAFTDADAVVASTWLSTLAQALRDPEALLAGTEVAADAGDRSVVARHSRRIGLLQQGATLRHPRGPFLQTVSLGVRRADFESVGGFDGALFSGGDADFCWRLTARQPTRRLSLVSTPLVYHHHRSTVAGLWRQFRRYGEGDVLLARKHGARPIWTIAKLGVDLGRVLVLPIRGVFGLGEAFAAKDVVPALTPWLRVLQIFARRWGQVGACLRAGGPRHRA